MREVILTAYVPKKHNSVWTGRAEVVSFSKELGTVILKMTSGQRKGDLGGFDIDKVRFKIVRSEG